jgi:hypothetical protein
MAAAAAPATTGTDRPATVIQEALESFGYLLICFGAITLHREIDSPAAPGPTAGRC